MSYSLFWRSPGLTPFTGKDTPIDVPAGSVVSNAASLRFTGKGAANYGKIQQENQLRLLENFAGPSAPDYPTVGQTWYDTLEGVLKVCVGTAPDPITWRSLRSTQTTIVGSPAPTPAVLSDTWFENTGSVSGIQYTYTGIGRYPEGNWDAITSGYFPSTSTTLNGKINFSTFSTPNYHEAYIHGFTASVPADVDGTILVNGSPVVVPRGVFYSKFPTSNGFVVWDNTGLFSTMVPGSSYNSVRQLLTGEWQVDDNTQWQTFTPVDGMLVIGVVTIADIDDDAAPGIASMTMWSSAKNLLEMTQVPSSQSSGAIGGWVQTFPALQVLANREEYAFIAGLVSELIGDTSAFGGAGAIGRSIQYLTPLNTLDASMQLAWKSAIPNDTNVLYSEALLNELHTDLNSGDWDKMLAAAKYAVHRLELPAGVVEDISDLPFVSDGRQVPAVLLGMPPSDVQHPSNRRKTNPRFGTVTLSQLYQETVNVLQAAIANRYVLKGMLGTSGVHTTFSPNVAVTAHTAFVANAAGTPFTTSVTHGIAVNFAVENTNIEQFFAAGQAIELVLRHEPSIAPTTADTNLKTVCDNFGRFRITNDAVYIMDNSTVPALSQVPGGIGFSSVNNVGVVLGSASSGGASLVLRAQLISTGTVHIFVDIVAGGATTGQLLPTWNKILDNELYNGTTRVFAAPVNFVNADKLGSTLFL